MSAMAENKEKVFDFYMYLFPEIRGMIINEMQPDDRVRFTRCSKSCQKEAKSSKKYIHALEFYASTQQYATISIGYHKSDHFDPDYKGFTWTFHQEDNGINYKKYTTRRGNLLNAELFREEMDSSIDVVDYATKLFQDLFRQFQNTIKSLTFLGDAFSEKLKNYDYGITSLRNLENMRINGDMDILHYFSMLRKPLKGIDVDRGQGASYLADCEEIYQITDFVSMSGVKITYEQMLRLPPRIMIPFGNITEIQIRNFIRSWQNGTLERKVTSCLWNNSRDKQFDIPKLFRFLGLDGDFTPAPPFDANMVGSRSQPKQFRFVINHNEDVRLKGILSCNNHFGQLLFDVSYLRH